MNENFGDWYREADIQPEQETLTNRWSGIEKLAASIDDSGVVELGRLFYGLTESGATRDVLKDAMFESDNTFSTKNTLEIKLLAGVCLVHIAEKQTDRTGQLAAYAIVCPTLLGRRTNIFVPLISMRANELLDERSGTLRQHAQTKRVQIESITDEITKIEESEEGDSYKVGGPFLRAALEKLTTSIRAVSKIANRLERVQALYREDSNILWWMTGRYSSDLDQPLKEIGLPGAAILVGKELADLIEIHPGPIAAKAVMNRCLEGVEGNPAANITLTHAVKKLPAEWKNKWFATDGNRDVLSLCPVTAAVRQSVAIDGAWGKAALSLTGVAATTKLSGTELAYQMYLECMFSKLM